MDNLLWAAGVCFGERGAERWIIFLCVDGLCLRAPREWRIFIAGRNLDNRIAAVD